MDPLKPSTSHGPSSIAPSYSTSPSPPCTSFGLTEPTLVMAHTPPNVDTLRDQVAGTLTNLVSGHIFGKSAAGKARDIAGLLPETVLTQDNLDRLEKAITANRGGVQRLLHHTDDQCGGVHGRATSRAVLVALLMQRGLEYASGEKNRVIAMSPAERTQYLKETLANLAGATPIERSDGLNSDASAPSPVQSTSQPSTSRTQSTGTAAHPLARQVDVHGARALALHACEHPEGAPPPLDRFAWITKPATSTTFVLTDSLSPCTPVIVFWKDASQVQHASLFHFLGWPMDAIEQIREHIKKTAPSARIDSVSFVERHMAEQNSNGDKERHIIKSLTEFADKAHVPFNLVHQVDKRSMAVIVDVQRFEITTMSSTDLTDAKFNHPLGNDRARYQLGT